MLALVLTIICSSGIALILKYNETAGGDPLVLLSGNYLSAACIGFLFFFIEGDFYISAQVIMFGSFLGLLFLFSFFSFAKAVSIAGAALATVSARLSVAVPLLASIIMFSEKPDFPQIFGFFLTLLTVVLFYISLNKKSNKLTFREYSFIIMVLVGIGISDFCMKLFQQWRPESEKTAFIFIIFLSSFIYTQIALYWKKIPVNNDVFIRGLVLGIPNVFSTVFLLLALSALPAIIVFPLTNVGIILITTLGARLIWKEKLYFTGILALITGILAIVFIGH